MHYSFKTFLYSWPSCRQTECLIILNRYEIRDPWPPFYLSATKVIFIHLLNGTIIFICIKIWFWFFFVALQFTLRWPLRPMAFLFLSSPELKDQVNFSDWNLSVVCHRHCCCHCKLFTFSSSSPEPLGQLKANLAESILGLRATPFTKGR